MTDSKCNHKGRIKGLWSAQCGRPEGHDGEHAGRDKHGLVRHWGPKQQRQDATVIAVPAQADMTGTQ